MSTEKIKVKQVRDYLKHETDAQLGTVNRKKENQVDFISEATFMIIRNKCQSQTVNQEIKLKQVC